MIKVLWILPVVFALTGCSIFDSYKTPIQQGRVITQKQINQIKPGMTENQVEFILGTPGIQDPFHPNTWNYVYTNKLGGHPRAEKKLAVSFKGGKLVKLSGDYIPPEPLKYQYGDENLNPPKVEKTVKKAIAKKPTLKITPKTPAAKVKTQDNPMWLRS